MVIEMEVELKKWGHSQGVIIPNEIIRENKLKTGDKLVIISIKKARVSGFGIAKGAAPFVRDDDLDREY